MGGLQGEELEVYLIEFVEVLDDCGHHTEQGNAATTLSI
jgi:hypothetical protein